MCKGYSPCKGYMLCKMVSLGQKLKMPKTSEKPFYKNIRFVLCKKPLQKTPNVREIRKFGKSAILQRLYPMQRLQALQNDQFGSKIENVKNMRRSILTELFSAKNRSEKHPIIEKGDICENRPSCKGYTVCKMVRVGQKLKIPKTCEKPFNKNITLVLLQKTAPKDTKYSTNETILKMGHLQKAIAHAEAIPFEKSSVWVKN